MPLSQTPEFRKLLKNPNATDEQLARLVLGLLTASLVRDNPPPTLAEAQSLRSTIESIPPFKAYGRAALRGGLTGALLGASALTFPSLISMLTGQPPLLLSSQTPSLGTLLGYIGGGAGIGALSHLLSEKLLRRSADKFEREYLDAIREGIYKDDFKTIYDRLKRWSPPLEWYVGGVLEKAPAVGAGFLWPLLAIPPMLDLGRALRRRTIDVDKLPENAAAIEGVNSAFLNLAKAIKMYHELKPHYEFNLRRQLPDLKLVGYPETYRKAFGPDLEEDESKEKQTD